MGVLLAAMLGFILPLCSPAFGSRWRELSEATEARELSEDSKMSSESEERSDEEQRQEGTPSFFRRSPRSKRAIGSLVPLDRTDSEQVSRVRYLAQQASYLATPETSGHRLSSSLLAPLVI